MKGPRTEPHAPAPLGPRRGATEALALERGRLERLGWKALAEVCVAPRAHPTVRRRAESLLALRLDALSSGERLTLARRASAAIILRLVDAPGDPRVLRGLLGNPRLSEPVALRLAASDRVPPPFLADLAEHPGWGARRAIQLALARNLRTPVAVALRLVGGLAEGDRKRLSDDDKVPTIVRVCATRLIEREARGPSLRSRLSPG
jgi:hypothetical protein